MNNELFVIKDGNDIPVESYKTFFPNLDFVLTGINCSIKIDASNIFDRTRICISCEKAKLTIGPKNDFHGVFLYMDVGCEEIVEIGANNTFLSGKIFLRDDACLKIGDRNFFEFGLVILASDGHTIIDLHSNKIINKSPRNNGFALPLEIGSHNWIGENVFLTKKTVLKNDSVIGAASVVTRAFDRSNIAIAGNPARIVREAVGWDRLPIMLYEKHVMGSPHTPPPHTDPIGERVNVQDGSDSCDLPEEFDYAFFASQSGHQDLSRSAARDFFNGHGRAQGICGSPLCIFNNFTEFLNNSFINKKILELGPGHCPRMKGDNLRFFDIRNSDQLLAWVKSAGLPVEHVPAVIHYVSENGDLSIIDDKFDLVFSSHNMEHVLDLVQHMLDVERLLKPGGLFACIVPDKRFTFDYFRRESTLDDVLAQHFQPALNHPLRAILDFRLNTTHNDSVRHWAGDHGLLPNREAGIQDIIQNYKSQNFTDTHRWVFTNDSFISLFAKLHELGFIGLKLMRCYNVAKNANAFNAIFKVARSHKH